MLVFAALAALAVLLLPADAYAWGPLTHIAHGSQVLEDLTTVAVALQGILQTNWREYLYGCIGADITQAKKYTRAEQFHCHSWHVGWQLVGHAETDAQRAFAYGYLSHLSSDVFSHNHFVPTQLVVSYRARALRHVYWEARFDSMQERQYRRLLTDLHRGRRFPDCDALVRDVVSRTLFSFDTNMRIFNSVLAWQQFETWHTVMGRISSRSQFPLPPEMIPAYNEACVKSIRELLREGRKASNQHADPTGVRALTLAKQVRRTLKTLARRRSITPELEAGVKALMLRPDGLAA